MENEFLEDFFVKMNDLQKQINTNYQIEFRNVTNQYEYGDKIYPELK